MDEPQIKYGFKMDLTLVDGFSLVHNEQASGAVMILGTTIVVVVLTEESTLTRRQISETIRTSYSTDVRYQRRR